MVYSLNETNFGHFEYIYKPGSTILSFTQKDIETNQIVFVHRSSQSNDSYISLQVSDGIEASSIAKLRIQTFPQLWRLENNTGVILMQETSVLITPFNLSFVSNVINSSINIEYHVTQGPQFGIIEVEKNVGTWENTAIYTNDDLRQHRVRYRHISGYPDFDEFQFRTSLNKTQVYTFRMTFVRCRLITLEINSLSLNSSQEGTLTPLNLEYRTSPVASPPITIKYILLSPPTYGFLFSAVSNYRLRRHDSFSQEDINSGNIKYRLMRKSYSSITDTILFKVIIAGCRNITGNLSIFHQPTNETVTAVRTVLERLQIEEGGRTNIAGSQLSIKSDSVTDLFFNVTIPPHHGMLQIEKSEVIYNNTNYFTLKELNSNHLFYVHDDSETAHDYFKFMALSREKEDFLFVEVFHIDIQLKNDNSPIRIVDKVFHVVVGGKKLLTSEDLAYFDSDIDTKPSDIIYTCRDLPNGEVYSAVNSSLKLMQFTQDDLNNGLILFKHRGPEYGKIKLWVTDGQFYVNTVLEVQASAPFIRVLTNKQLIVKHGSKAELTKDNLSYSTNLYAVDEDIVYEITAKPAFGKIVLEEKSKVIVI